MHPASASSPRARRRRGAELEEALLAAAWAELTEKGYAALTFDAVARRACTSRPVVNRRWATKDVLVRDALEWASDRFVLQDPDTGSLRSDTIALMEQLNAEFSAFAAGMTAHLAAYFEETRSSPAELRETLLGTRWDLIEAVVARAVARGEVDRSKLTPRIVRLPYDLLRHEALMTLKPMTPAAIREVVDTIFMTLLK